MTQLSAAELDQLAPIYLVANTPEYLYRRFRAESAIQRLAEQSKPADLVNLILQVDRSAERAVHKVVAAYAATVGLTLQDSREVLRALEGFEVTNLNWVDKILQLWDQNRTATTLETVAVRRPKILEPSTVSDITESRTRIKLSGDSE